MALNKIISKIGIITPSRLQKPTLWIGIDAGATTGLAFYDKQIENIHMESDGFWGALQKIRYQLDHNMFTHNIVFVVENPALNKITWRRKGESEGVQDRMARNVGMNIAHAALWIEFAKQEGYRVIEVKPQNTKKDAKEFKKTFNVLNKTNQHERDAYCLVIGR